MLELSKDGRRKDHALERLAEHLIDVAQNQVMER
jgi:hypothetical protein